MTYTNPMKHEIGERVTVTAALQIDGEVHPPRPWEGVVIKVETGVDHFYRSAKVYYVKTDNGAVLQAYFGGIKKTSKQDIKTSLLDVKGHSAGELVERSNEITARVIAKKHGVTFRKYGRWGSWPIKAYGPGVTGQDFKNWKEAYDWIRGI